MIKEILFKIQQEFKSSKNLINDFAKFNYRNLECMLSDLKPILTKYECTITFNDEIVNIGNYNYIKSTATLTHIKDGESVSTTAFAREDETKAGMSAGQMTGCGSSYSRKYALCGLCAVNEEKDLDALDNRPNTASTIPSKPAKDNLTILKDFCAEKKLEESINKDELLKFFNYYQPKMGEWRATLNPDKLWQKWISK